MQIKTTKPQIKTSYLLGCLLSKRQEIINAGKNVEKRESLCTVGGMCIGTATMKNGMETPQEIKNRTII